MRLSPGAARRAWRNAGENPGLERTRAVRGGSPEKSRVSAARLTSNAATTGRGGKSRRVRRDIDREEDWSEECGVGEAQPPGALRGTSPTANRAATRLGRSRVVAGSRITG